MFRTGLAYLMCLLLCVACVHPPAVQKIKSGIYILDFKRASIPNFEDSASQAVHIQVVHAYLVNAQLVPAECQMGIQVLKVGYGENGYAYANFICRKPEAVRE